MAKKTKKQEVVNLLHDDTYDDNRLFINYVCEKLKDVFKTGISKSEVATILNKYDSKYKDFKLPREFACNIVRKICESQKKELGYDSELYKNYFEYKIDAFVRQADLTTCYADSKELLFTHDDFTDKSILDLTLDKKSSYKLGEWCPYTELVNPISFDDLLSIACSLNIVTTDLKNKYYGKFPENQELNSIAKIIRKENDDNRTEQINVEAKKQFGEINKKTKRDNTVSIIKHVIGWSIAIILMFWGFASFNKAFKNKKPSQQEAHARKVEKDYQAVRKQYGLD